MTPAGDATESISTGRQKAGIVIVLGALIAAACGSTTTLFVGSTALANFIYTDKLPSDYLAEFATGEECSFLKSQKDGGPLCRESFDRVVYERPIYCYRTLAEINCYDKPDPYGGTSRRVQ